MLFNFCQRCCCPCIGPCCPPSPPVPPIIPPFPLPTPISSGRKLAYFTSTNSGSLGLNALIPFTQAYNSDTDDIGLNATGTGITLAPGNYLVEYNTGASNATAANVGATATLNGTAIPNSSSNATVSANESTTLAQAFVVNVPTGANATLALANTGATATTFAGTNIVVQKI